MFFKENKHAECSQCRALSVIDFWGWYLMESREVTVLKVRKYYTSRRNRGYKALFDDQVSSDLVSVMLICDWATRCYHSWITYKTWSSCLISYNIFRMICMHCARFIGCCASAELQFFWWLLSQRRHRVSRAKHTRIRRAGFCAWVWIIMIGLSRCLARLICMSLPNSRRDTNVMYMKPYSLADSRDAA